jgi:hypothetical protein
MAKSLFEIDAVEDLRGIFGSRQEATAGDAGGIDEDR